MHELRILFEFAHVGRNNWLRGITTYQEFLQRYVKIAALAHSQITFFFHNEKSGRFYFALRMGQMKGIEALKVEFACPINITHRLTCCLIFLAFLFVSKEACYEPLCDDILAETKIAAAEQK